MAHIKHFGISNFRIFDKLTEFDFAPITILTGTNSSGKSSLINAIKVVSQYTKKRPNAFSDKLFEKETENPFGKTDNLINNKQSPVNNVIEFNFNTQVVDTLLQLNFSLAPNRNVFNLDKIEIINTNTKELLTKYTLNGPEHIQELFFPKTFQALGLNDKIPSVNNVDLFTKEQLDQFMSVNKWVTLEKGVNFEILDYIKESNSYIFKDFDSVKIDLLDLEVYINSNFSILLPKYTYTAIQSNYQYSPSFVDMAKEVDYLLSTAVFNLVSNLNKYFDVNEISKVILEEVFLKSNNNILLFLLYCEVVTIKEYSQSYKLVESTLKSQIKDSSQSIFNSWSSIESISNALLFGNRILVGESEYHDLVIEFKNTGWFNRQSVKEFLIEQLITFKIGDDVLIIPGEEGVSTNIKIKQGNHEVYLSDLGFGISKVLPIILKICTLAAKNCYSDFEHIGDIKKLKIFMNENYNYSTLLIEEPESNLHPALQSKLADMFADANKRFNMQFIIETHSEYLIRKLQYLTASNKSDLKPDDTVLYYFYPPAEVPNNESQVKKINILADGSLTDDFGSGFFDEANRIAISLFGLQHSQSN